MAIVAMQLGAIAARKLMRARDGGERTRGARVRRREVNHQRADL